jgi:hypothetical protein
VTSHPPLCPPGWGVGCWVGRGCSGWLVFKRGSARRLRVFLCVTRHPTFLCRPAHWARHRRTPVQLVCGQCVGVCAVPRTPERWTPTHTIKGGRLVALGCDSQGAHALRTVRRLWSPGTACPGPLAPARPIQGHGRAFQAFTCVDGKGGCPLPRPPRPTFPGGRTHAPPPPPRERGKRGGPDCSRRSCSLCPRLRPAPTPSSHPSHPPHPSTRPSLVCESPHIARASPRRQNTKQECPSSPPAR